MHGLHKSRSLATARAILAGAAILASAASPAKAQEANEDALAIPRLPITVGAPLALPRPLSSAAARLVRDGFRDTAAPLDDLRDNILLGHIEASRLLSAAARPSVPDLLAWLAAYPAQPDAPAIHSLLLNRLPRGAPAPAAPVLAGLAAAPSGDDVDVPDPLLHRNRALDRTIHDVAHTQPERAVHLVAGVKGLGREYGALLRAEIAQALFSQGRDRDALPLAEQAARESRGTVGLPAWIAGISAWRLGRPELARTWFEAAWRAPLNTPHHRAAAAYWAARSNLVTRGEHGPWMRRAAQESRTFYGLLARHVLGLPILGTVPATPDMLAQADIDAVAASDRGQRAFALIQVEQPARAAAELRLLFAETRDLPGFGRSVLLVAQAAGLTDLATQLTGVLQPASVKLPATQLRPNGGFRVEPALVYALTRLESNFDPTAVSPTGARGLMQIMPGTAKALSDGAPPALHNPATNLDLGQRLLLRLMERDDVGADLIRLLAAYNAGVGNFGRWLETIGREQDPLLFIEALPNEETRCYVPKALAYTWLYAAQSGQPSASLDELSAGAWPRVPLRSRPVLAGLH